MVVWGSKRKIAHKFRYPIWRVKDIFCQKPTFCTFDEMVGLGGGGGLGAQLYYLECCYFILARAVGGSVDDAVCWG